ncbi:hypothetical protein [uncultured Mitsuokella sp.]|uniref:hypothetical protein n=1 Tax=uncultured Mitsuokella sp. TaxID=453120 RepID=UPI0026DDC3C0|nr:hypothetical protein [uncultured Mitsuokella sp.]
MNIFMNMVNRVSVHSFAQAGKSAGRMMSKAFGKKTAALCVPLLAGLTLFAAPAVTQAAYVTAYQNIVYEKDVVDTNSIYNPDKDHFNCVVYTFHSDTDKGQPYIYKYMYDEGEMVWKIHADGQWNTVESGSLAASVLKVCLPYLK